MKNLFLFFVSVFLLSMISPPTIFGQTMLEEQMAYFWAGDDQKTDSQKVFSILEHQNKSQQSLGNPPPSIQLDSMVIDRYQPQTGLFEKYRVRTFQYDAQFNTTEMRDLAVNDSTNSQELKDLITLGYDTNGDLISYERTHDYVAGAYTAGFRTTVTYSNNLWISSVEEMFDSTQTWVFIRKYERAYDSNGNMIENTWSDWVNGAWEPFRFVVYTYNSLSQLDVELESEYITGAWVPKIKVEYTYDVLGNQTQNIRSNYMNGIWELHFRDVHSYDIYGNRIHTTGNYHMNGVWVLHSQIINSYTPSGLTEKRERFSYVNNNWRPSYTYEYSYDAQQNNLVYNNLRWDSNMQQWDTAQSKVHTFDSSVPFADLLIPAYPFTYNFSEFLFRHKLLTANESRHDYQTDMYKPHDKKRFYYSPVVINSSEDPATVNPVSVFPNPATDRLYFDIPNMTSPPTVSLYQMNGQLVIASRQLTDSVLQLPELSTGVYMYLVELEGKQYSGKVMIE